MRGEGGSHPKLRSIFKSRQGGVSAAVMTAAAAVSDLTGVGGLVHFPQLDTPVEPDDGAEGERWQHALSSSENLLAVCYWSSLVKDLAGRGPCVVRSPRSNEVV